MCNRPPKRADKPLPGLSLAPRPPPPRTTIGAVFRVLSTSPDPDGTNNSITVVTTVR